MAGKCVPRLTEEPDCSGRGNGTFCIGPYALIARPPSCPAEATRDNQRRTRTGARGKRVPGEALAQVLRTVSTAQAHAARVPIRSSHVRPTANDRMPCRPLHSQSSIAEQRAKTATARANIVGWTNCAPLLVRSRIVAGKRTTCPNGQYCDNAGTGDPVDKSTCQLM